MIKKFPKFKTAYTDNPPVQTDITKIEGELETVQEDAQCLDVRYMIDQHVKGNIVLPNSDQLQYADISKLKTLPEYMDTLSEITEVYQNLSPEYARQYPTLDYFINSMIKQHSNPVAAPVSPEPDPQQMHIDDVVGSDPKDQNK